MESNESNPSSKDQLPFRFLKEKRQTYDPNSVAVLVYRVIGRRKKSPYDPSLDTPADEKFNTSTEMVKSLSRFFFGMEEDIQFKGLEASDYSNIVQKFMSLTEKVAALPHEREPYKMAVPQEMAQQFVKDNISHAPLEANESANLLAMINGNPRAKLWFHKIAVATDIRNKLGKNPKNIEALSQWFSKELDRILQVKTYKTIKSRDLEAIGFLRNNSGDAIRVMIDVLEFAKDYHI